MILLNAEALSSDSKSLFDLSRWTRFHHTCLILSIRSFSKMRSGGDAEAKADEMGSFLSERGPGTSHISASHAQEKKLRTFSLLLLGLGEFLLVLFFDFILFFHLDSHEVRNGESCWAGQAGRLLGPPPLWSPRRILTPKVGQPLRPPTPGQSRSCRRRADGAPPPRLLRPRPPAPLRGEGGGGEGGGTCEPSPNCRMHTLLPGSGGGPQGAPLLD